MPFLNAKGFLTRVISLGGLPEESGRKGATPYIQAIEIEPLTAMGDRIKNEIDEGIVFNSNPYQCLTESESVAQDLQIL